MFSILTWFTRLDLPVLFYLSSIFKSVLWSHGWTWNYNFQMYLLLLIACSHVKLGVIVPTKNMAETSFYDHQVMYQNRHRCWAHWEVSLVSNHGRAVYRGCWGRYRGPGKLQCASTVKWTTSMSAAKQINKSFLLLLLIMKRGRNVSWSGFEYGLHT